ncbi:MAG TPA: hypothetical protein VND99_00235 [Candidatus Acidoferrales bacterium]|nr:hypothetical protein [Candidatus Acidoferrales bacterium]
MSKNKLPQWATTMTPFSKYLALSMLVILPVLAFFYGTYYQRQIDKKKPQQGTIIFKILPTRSPSAFPSISQPISASPSQPASGSIKCNTNADCPPDYLCTQVGPIVYTPHKKPQLTCWKKGSAMPL